MDELAKELHEVVAETWKAYRKALQESSTVESFVSSILVETDPLEEKFRKNDEQMELYTRLVRPLVDVTCRYMKRCG